MTLGELITHITSGAKALFEWLGDFVGGFFEIFFHQTSWMESDVITVALVVFSYLYLLIRIGDSELVKSLMDSEFRSRKKKGGNNGKWQRPERGQSFKSRRSCERKWRKRAGRKTQNYGLVSKHSRC